MDPVQFLPTIAYCTCYVRLMFTNTGKLDVTCFPRRNHDRTATKTIDEILGGPDLSFLIFRNKKKFENKKN